MKIIYLLCFLLLSPAILAESVTAHPFILEFFSPQEKFNVRAKLSLSCRYEKFVISDSSEYVVRTEDLLLPVEALDVGEQTHFKVALKEKALMKLDGVFKSNKGCMSQVRLTFLDKKYAVGWAGQMSRPINITLSTGQYYEAGDTELDLSKLEEKISYRLMDFLYHPVPHLQVNIWLTADGIKLPESPTSSAIDPRTNMPYILSNE